MWFQPRIEGHPWHLLLDPQEVWDPFGDSFFSFACTASCHKVSTGLSVDMGRDDAWDPANVLWWCESALSLCLGFNELSLSFPGPQHGPSVADMIIINCNYRPSSSSSWAPITRTRDCSRARLVRFVWAQGLHYNYFGESEHIIDLKIECVKMRRQGWRWRESSREHWEPWESITNVPSFWSSWILVKTERKQEDFLSCSYLLSICFPSRFPIKERIFWCLIRLLLCLVLFIGEIWIAGLVLFLAIWFPIPTKMYGDQTFLMIPIWWFSGPWNYCCSRTLTDCLTVCKSWELTKLINLLVCARTNGRSVSWKKVLKWLLKHFLWINYKVYDEQEATFSLTCSQNLYRVLRGWICKFVSILSTRKKVQFWNWKFGPGSWGESGL